MRRYYNVLYEAPAGIDQEGEAEEETALNWAEARTPAVAVEIEPFTEKDKAGRTTRNAGVLANKSRTKKETMHNATRVIAVGNPIYGLAGEKQRANSPIKKRKAECAANGGAGLKAARPGAPAGGARAPQQGKRRRTETSGGKATCEQLEEIGAKRRRKERNQPKGYG